MGVPVLSLIGDCHVNRVGLSLLTRVGLEVFTCQSRQEYINKAVSSAKQLDHLATIRSRLRARMAQSALCDKVAYTRCVEQTYREMWRRYLDEDKKIGR